jgi:hypothetical protein
MVFETDLKKIEAILQAEVNGCLSQLELSWD